MQNEYSFARYGSFRVMPEAFPLEKLDQCGRIVRWIELLHRCFLVRDGVHDDGGVDTGVFDKPFMGFHPTTDHSGQEQSGHIGLHGLGACEAQVGLHCGQGVGAEARALLAGEAQFVLPALDDQRVVLEP